MFVALYTSLTATLTRTTKLTAQYQVLNDLMRMYSTPEMGDSVKAVHDFADPSTYLSTCHIHYDRRRVSHFYQLMGIMYERDAELRAPLLELWHKDDLKIIHDRLIPMEEALAKELNVEPRTPRFIAMTNLYWDAQGHTSKIVSRQPKVAS